ncbi:hypothetical protein EYZ11_008706 [Aspergillus tanneri]|uniref:VWFA domain-containing protein n=1 Tax=Aspergillus tanneri TaxID=1220188 RepID=A0A4S3J9V4_9EURO|nr:uncharacterized protein ATNIH1004_009746 [Aspergillus tanneri]KAA8642984.1 hypothetical protein ATNIH1004_009746 [Aspergillus tanneri]THC91836.1 hypothetical protein EYZ11_008706 [Aspergillus tanneri]
MDVLDRLQSGLFFQQLRVIDSVPNSNHPNPLEDQSVPRADCRYVSPPSDHAPGPTHTPSLSHTPETPLPLLSVSVDVELHGRLCTTRVTQQFSNTSSCVAQNAKYIFPIYDGSVVTSFRCRVGSDRLLEGAVKTKEAARADFHHAVSQHKVAVLVEELAPEVFETNVGNVPGQTTVKIEITYANLLKVDNSTGGLVLTIPTSIAPRYGVAPEWYSANQPLLTEGLRVNVQASMPAIIRKMESRSHPISVEIGSVAHHNFTNFAVGATSETLDLSKGRATLAGRSAVLDQDFVLYILSSSRESTKSQALAAAQPDQPSLTTVAVTIHPGDLFLQGANTEGFDGEIIFMADRSGSMSSKMHSLISVMNVFLRSLPQKCFYNIASFGSRFSWLWPASEKYSQENLSIASQYVGSFEANFGGTEIYSALESVLGHYNKRSDVATSVILLTDGEVWDVDNVIQLVRRTVLNRESNIRFFSIGIGDRVSHRLVEGIGQQGGGYAEVVPESSMGSWQESVIQMLKAALTPSRLQCEVHLDQGLTTRTSERQVSGYTLHYPTMIQAPYHIPMLNTFSYFSLYFILERGLESLPATVTVSATTDKGEKLTTQLPLQKATDQTAIHHLAAKALMNDYETGKSWLHTLNSSLESTNPAAFNKVLEQQAQHLGQKWSITSKWTSYVAIDRTSIKHHEISIQKADTIEIAHLTRPRPRPAPFFDLPSSMSSESGTELPAVVDLAPPALPPTLSNSMCSGSVTMMSVDSNALPNSIRSREDTELEQRLCKSIRERMKGLVWAFKRPRNSSPYVNENSRVTKPPRSITMPSSIQAEELLSLDKILLTQEASGKFHLGSFRHELSRKYGTLALERFLDDMFDNNLSVQRSPGFRHLHLNILAVVYITDQHAASKGLWELQVAKARQWIKQKIIELLKEKGDLKELPEISLEDLERSIITELHEKDPRGT